MSTQRKGKKAPKKIYRTIDAKPVVRVAHYHSEAPGGAQRCLSGKGSKILARSRRKQRRGHKSVGAIRRTAQGG